MIDLTELKEMSGKKVSVNFFLPEHLHKKAMEISNDKGISLSELIRNSIKNTIDEHEKGEEDE